MLRKKKVSRQLKEVMECSNCFCCGWRMPLNNLPEYCLWDLRCNHSGDPLSEHPRCDRYVDDMSLKGHLQSLLNLECGGESDDKQSNFNGASDA